MNERDATGEEQVTVGQVWRHHQTGLTVKIVGVDPLLIVYVGLDGRDKRRSGRPRKFNRSALRWYELRGDA